MEPSKARRVQYILKKLCSKAGSSFAVRLWDGSILYFGDKPQFTLVFNDRKTFKKLIVSPNAFTAGEAFIKKKIDLEGDIFAALKLKDHFESLSLTLGDKLVILFNLLLV